MDTVLAAAAGRLKEKTKTRILAFGSSNTERFLPGMHWFDVLDLAIQNTHGRIHRCVNTGIGGNTSRDLLARFEDDAALHHPHIAIITIGGNDSNPDRRLGAEEFTENLRKLHALFKKIGCAAVFQTYYAPDPARNGDLSNFHKYMDIVRGVAKESGSGLIDQLRRWEAFRKAFPNRYLPLMEDGFHLNRRGNAVMGLELARAFQVSCTAKEPDYWREAMEIQELMDRLEPVA